MKTKTVLILAIFHFLPGLNLLPAQPSSKCLAVITEIKGDALIKKSNRSDFEKASWGTQLFQNDQIRTSERSEAKLLFSNNSFISLGANSTITISGEESPVAGNNGNIKRISSAAIVNLSAFNFKRDDAKDVGALAGVRSGNAGQIIEPTSPCNTLIKTNNPTFSWVSKKSFDKYIVNLYNSKGLVWSSKVSGTMLKYPEDQKGLDFGESYFWYVEGEDLIDTVKSAKNKFSVCSLEKSKEVEAQERIIRNTFRDEPESSSLHSVLGAYYINNGLLQDAINEFQAIAKINADAALPYEILGSLYVEVGNKDKAIAALKKALMLTNQDK